MQAGGFLIKSVLIIKQPFSTLMKGYFKCYGHMSITHELCHTGTASGTSSSPFTTPAPAPSEKAENQLKPQTDKAQELWPLSTNTPAEGTLAAADTFYTVVKSDSCHHPPLEAGHPSNQEATIYNLSEYRSILLNIQTSLRHVQYGKFYWV